jgi:hypothetical protein
MNRTADRVLEMDVFGHFRPVGHPEDTINVHRRGSPQDHVSVYVYVCECKRTQMLENTPSKCR